jgi:uncharacterized membrane protein YhaH (DUF805 family)
MYNHIVLYFIYREDIVMSFIDAIKSCFTQYVGFRGRARRSEYWYFFLLNCGVSVLLSVLATATKANFFYVLSAIYGLAVMLPGLGVCIRRLHDIGKRWPFIFMGLIPVAGSIILIVNLAKDSEPGDNQFGPNPKGM